MSMNWIERQYVGVLLACCGFIATIFTGAVAYNVRGLAQQAQEVPILQQRIQVLQDAQGEVKKIQEILRVSLNSQDKILALVEQRLSMIDSKVGEVNGRLQKLSDRLGGVLGSP